MPRRRPEAARTATRELERTQVLVDDPHYLVRLLHCLGKPGGSAGCSPAGGAVASAFMAALRPLVTVAFLSALCVSLAASAFAGGRTAGKPLELGQGMKIAGTDLGCGFGGVAGHAGITCARNGPTATRNSWAFRLEEGQLVAYHFLNGKTATRTWKEPRTKPEPTGAGGQTGLANVGTARIGSGFFADGTDIGCGVATFGGKVGVGCAKRDAIGQADIGSYGIELTQTTVQVIHVDASGNVKTVFAASTAGRS